MSIDYSRLPAHNRAGMQRYIEHGIAPGSFLSAVLSNDLMGALGKADEVNRAQIFDICVFLYNEAPAGCYGSAAKFKAWRGINAEKEAQS